MRNWVFDIQRFGTDSDFNNLDLVINDLTPGAAAFDTYYDATGKKVTLTGVSADTKVIRVTLSPDGTYTMAFGTITASTDKYADDNTNGVQPNSITITAKSSVATYEAGDGSTKATVGPDTLVMTSATGGKVVGTATGGAAVTYQATTGKTATIQFGATADGIDSTLKSGSVDLTSSDTTKSVIAGSNAEVVTAVAGTSGASTVTVSSDGKVTGLDAGEKFNIGTDAGTQANVVQYAVSADGYSIGTTVDDGSGNAVTATYLLTSKLSNTTVTSSAGHSKVDDISNGALADNTSLTVNGDAVKGFSSEGTKASSYVYTKGGDIFTTGYTDSSNGTLVGTLTADGAGNWKYDGSSYSNVQELADDAANKGGKTNVVTVIGGSGNDIIDYSGATLATTIVGGAGKDSINAKLFENTSVAGGAGNDEIVINDNGAGANNVVLDGGDGNDLVTVTGALSNNTYGWSILGGAGNDTVDLDTTALTQKNTEWLINLGDGNNVASIGAAVTYSTITAGSGNDTIRVTGTDAASAATNTVTGGAGNDVFDISVANTGANIADYSFGSDSLLVTAATDAAINTVAQTTADLTTEGVITDGMGTATLTSSGAFYAATLVDADRNKVNVAWTKDSATSIDATSVGVKSVLVGTRNGSEGDLLVGSAKADTLYAGANDSVYGGAGADAISLGASAYGVYVGVATDSGADTVADFNTGFDIDSADAVYMVNGTVADVDINNDGTNVTVKDGKGSLELTNRGSNSTSGVKLLVGDKKVYSIAEGVQLAISDAEDLADYYYGTKSTANGSGISLANYADDVSVDLSNAMFKNIASVTGGSANTTIMGSTAAETLFGGTGATSLYGGAGKDSLVSGTGVTTFFLTNGAGKDSVSGFVTGTDESASDVVNIFNAGLTGITRSATDSFTVKVSDTDSLQIGQATSGVDQKIQWVSGAAKGVAKIGMSSQANNFSYEEGVTNYLGGSRNDTISFGSGSEDINLWLDQVSAVSSIETFDASSRSGSVLIAGSSAASETLRGGSGDSSLWGGNGNAADVLVGNTSGTTSFFYGMGQGSDSISGGTNDTVNLYDMQLSDLASANVDTSNRRVIFTTTAGDTVTVSGGVQNFSVGGTTYQTTYASSTDWTAKA